MRFPRPLVRGVLLKRYKSAFSPISAFSTAARPWPIAPIPAARSVSPGAAAQQRKHSMKAAAVAATVGLVLTSGAPWPAVAKPCITIVTHEDDQLGFRNACSVCKRAAWSWAQGNRDTRGPARSKAYGKAASTGRGSTRFLLAAKLPSTQNGPRASCFARTRARP
jgi:hypothetical protein